MSTFRKKATGMRLPAHSNIKLADPIDKDLKKGKAKELLEPLPKKLGKAKSGPRKPIAKTS